MKLTAASVFVCFLFHCHASAERANSRRNGLVNAYESSYENDECLDNFDVSENTIIRTQDSRTLGARYLNETEFATKRECMQWCCQTADCNVAVYEDKNHGSCYSFDCGTPSEFKCKFTSHSHYTSAILKVNRHSYDLGKWGFEAKHEEELSHLREKGIGRSTMSIPVITSTPSTTTSTSSIAPTSLLNANVVTASTKSRTNNSVLKVEPERRCSRFQFECRNSSECIAIYNACDGIPQCADGSDESSELGCPTEKRKNVHGNSQSNEFHRNPSTEQKWQANNDEMVSQNSIESNRKNWDKPISSNGVFKSSPQDSLYPQHLDQPDQQTFLNEHHVKSNQLLEHQQPFQQISNSDNENAASVFNHKAPGLVSSKEGYEYSQSSNYYHAPSSQQGYADAYDGNSRDDFNEPNYNHVQQHSRPQQHTSLNYHSSDYANNDYWHIEKNKHAENLNTYQKPILTGEPQMFDENSGQMYPHGQNPNHADLHTSSSQDFVVGNSYPLRKKFPPQKLPQQMKSKTQFEPYEETTQNEKPPNFEAMRPKADFHHLPSLPKQDDSTVRNSKQQQFTESKYHSKNFEHKSSKQETTINNQKSKPNDVSVVSEEVTSAASTHHVSGVVHSHPQMNKLELNLAEVEVQKVEQRSESNGAVVALTLGLSITGILLVLVGCRVRMVRRHLRRGRSPYAHDADYLVNGMYL